VGEGGRDLEAPLPRPGAPAPSPVALSRAEAATAPLLGSRARLAGSALAVLASAGALFVAVRPTNFIGSDEWLYLSLLSRGIVDSPYSNRPLNFVWGLPAHWLFPNPLHGLLVIHVLWIGLGGILVFLAVRRLLGGALVPAFLAGTFTIVWAPADSTRLVPAHMFIYSGCTFGALLGAWLALEAWATRRALLAVGAVLAAALAVLSHEAALAPLAVVPLLWLAEGGRREPRRLAGATLAALGVLGVLALRAAWPLWAAPERLSYQTEVQSAELGPARLAGRALGQLRRHLHPLVEAVPADATPSPTVPLALAVFGVGFAVSARPGRARGGAPESLLAKDVPRRRLAAVAAGGLAWALAAYVPFVASTQTRGAARTEFLSAPGVGVFLAAASAAIASFLPRRPTTAVLGLVGAWVVTLGALRTTAFQSEWDRGSPYRDQRRVLLGVTSIAPRVVDGTLLVLLTHGRAWPLDLSFRHAIAYLYEGGAVGHAPDSDPFLYETSFEEGGIRSSPAPVIREPWREAPRVFPYASVVVLREDAVGRIGLVETWPEDLPPLPPGATYAPRGRILPVPRSPRVAILDR
jgi:hypothetical protein